VERSTVDETFKEFDHCGDVGIEAWGKTVERVIENATVGLFSLMTTRAVTPLVEREIYVDAASGEDALVDWLSEVITTASTFGELYADVSIERLAAFSLRGWIRGEPIDEHRHELRFDVKAATYHQLVFERIDEGFHARVIFDL
jgi:SHS2 domain-containing protein